MKINLPVTITKGRFRMARSSFPRPTSKAMPAEEVEIVALPPLERIGHTETLNGVTDALKMLAPAVYRKPPP